MRSRRKWISLLLVAMLIMVNWYGIVYCFIPAYAASPDNSNGAQGIFSVNLIWEDYSNAIRYEVFEMVR